jgi:signal peptidase II
VSKDRGAARRKARLLLVALIVLSCIGCDRASKSVAQATLVGAPSRSLLNGMVTLTYTENPGAFLGLGARLPEPVRNALGIVTTLLVLAIGIALLRHVHQISIPLLTGVSLLIGGGVGNLIDRATNGGRVIDFVVFRLGPFQTGVLNVADIAITAGAIAATILTMVTPRSQGRGDLEQA